MSIYQQFRIIYFNIYTTGLFDIVLRSMSNNYNNFTYNAYEVHIIFTTII